jgi:hypothetical protein
MKKALLTVLSVAVLGVSVAAADPLCTDRTSIAAITGDNANFLKAYQDLALHGVGCNIGDLLFTNFNYSYTLSGGGFGAAIAPTSVTVAVNPVTDQLQFSAGWVVGGGKTANLEISYNVTASPSRLSKLTSAFTSSTLPVVGGQYTFVESATCTGGTCGPTTFTNMNLVGITPTNATVLIDNKIKIDGSAVTGTPTQRNQQVGHISVVQDSFGLAPPLQTAPEPITFLLTGAGIGALVLLRKRRS